MDIKRLVSNIQLDTSAADSAVIMRFRVPMISLASGCERWDSILPLSQIHSCFDAHSICMMYIPTYITFSIVRHIFVLKIRTPTSAIMQCISDLLRNTSLPESQDVFILHYSPAKFSKQLHLLQTRRQYGTESSYCLCKKHSPPAESLVYRTNDCDLVFHVRPCQTHRRSRAIRLEKSWY